MLQGVRSPLWPMWFPVYASIVLFGFSILLNNCNTRYEWLVRPYSAGTFTLQETPSFAWRTNGLAHLPSGAGKTPLPTRTSAGKSRRVPSKRSEVRWRRCWAVQPPLEQIWEKFYHLSGNTVCPLWAGCQQPNDGFVLFGNYLQSKETILGSTELLLIDIICCVIS